MADRQVDGEGTRPGLLDLEKELVCSVRRESLILSFLSSPDMPMHLISNLSRYAQISCINLSLSWTVCTPSAAHVYKSGSPGRSYSLGPAEPRDSLARHVEPPFGRQDLMRQSRPYWRCFSRQTLIDKSRQKKGKRSRKNTNRETLSYRPEIPNRVTRSQMKKTEGW